jgi:hypothetical protein
MTDAGIPFLALVLQLLMATYVYLCSRFLICYTEMYMMIKNRIHFCSVDSAFLRSVQCKNHLELLYTK